MSTTQMKPKPVPSAREHLTQVAQELTLARTQLGQVETRHQAIGEELGILLAQSKASEKEASELQSKLAEARRNVQTAQADLTRALGKPSEEVYVSKLAESEAVVTTIQAEIEAFELRTKRSETLKRIAELRGLIQRSEQSVTELQHSVRDMAETHESAIIAEGKEAIRALLLTFQDMLMISEQYGPVLSELRNSEPHLYNKLLNILMLTPDVWGQLWTSYESHDGKIANFRGPLYEKQAEVKQELKKLNQ